MEKIKNRIKRLFSTPGRVAITALVAVFAIALFTAGGVFASIIWDVNEDRVEGAVIEKIAPDFGPTAATEDTTPAPDMDSDNSAPAMEDDSSAPGTEGENSAPADRKISQEKAEKIALDDSGFTRDEVTNLYSYYEVDDGYRQYEIQFFKGEMEYEYAIDADSGAVLEIDVDYIYD